MTRCARSRGLPERAESTADPAEFQMEGPALDAVSGATAFGQAEEPAASSQGDHLSGHHSQDLLPSRSQVSTAVSFERRPAASAVVASRSSGEGTALSAADLEGEHSSLPQKAPTGPATSGAPVGELQQLQETVSNLSGILPAVQSPRGQQRGSSPLLHRTNSIISQTVSANCQPADAGRAGTPGSVYGQATAEQHVRAASPDTSQAGEQFSTAGDQLGHPQQQASLNLTQGDTPHGPRAMRAFPQPEQPALLPPRSSNLTPAQFNSPGTRQSRGRAAPLAAAAAGAVQVLRPASSAVQTSLAGAHKGPKRHKPAELEARAVHLAPARMSTSIRFAVPSAAGAGHPAATQLFNFQHLAEAQVDGTGQGLLPQTSGVFSSGLPPSEPAQMAMTGPAPVLGLEQPTSPVRALQADLSGQWPAEATNSNLHAAQGDQVELSTAQLLQRHASAAPADHEQLLEQAPSIESPPKLPSIASRLKRTRAQAAGPKGPHASTDGGRAGGLGAQTHMGDSEVAAAKRAKHGSNAATSALLDDAPLRLVNVPPPPAFNTSQQGPAHAAASVHGTVAVHDEDGEASEGVVMEQIGRPVAAVTPIPRLDSTLGMATAAAAVQFQGGGQLWAASGPDRDASTLSVSSIGQDGYEPSITMAIHPSTGQVAVSSPHQVPMPAASTALGVTQEHAQLASTQAPASATTARRGVEAEASSSAAAAAAAAAAAGGDDASTGAQSHGMHAAGTAGAAGVAQVPGGRVAMAAGPDHVRQLSSSQPQGSTGSAIGRQEPQEAELYTASGLAPAVSHASRASYLDRASPEPEAAARPGIVQAMVLPAVRTMSRGSGAEGLSAIRVAPPRFAIAHRLVAPAAAGAGAGESQATSNAQMPLTAPLHVPRRPASRSVTQAVQSSRSPSHQTPIGIRLSPVKTPASKVAVPSGVIAQAQQASAEPGAPQPGLHGAGHSMELQSQLAAGIINQPVQNGQLMSAAGALAETPTSLPSTGFLPAQSNGHMSCNNSTNDSPKDSSKAVTSPGGRKRKKPAAASLSTASLSPATRVTRAQSCDA